MHANFSLWRFLTFTFYSTTVFLSFKILVLYFNGLKGHTIPFAGTLLGNLVSPLFRAPIKRPEPGLPGCKGLSYSVGFGFPRLLCHPGSALFWLIFPLLQRSWDSRKDLTFPRVFLDSILHGLATLLVSLSIMGPLITKISSTLFIDSALLRRQGRGCSHAIPCCISIFYPLPCMVAAG